MHPIFKAFLKFYFLPFMVFSCASIERDLYFKKQDAKTSWIESEPQPGRYSKSEPIPIDEDGSIFIHTYVENKSSGSYLWGFIIPIIPVFYLPDFKFHLDPNENLKINCSISYWPAKHHLVQDSRGFRMNENGLKLYTERAKLGADKCRALTITLEDGTTLTPLKTSNPHPSLTVFEFDKKAASLRAFSYRISAIELNSKEKKEIDVVIPVVFEDYTRYYTPKIAP